MTLNEEYVDKYYLPNLEEETLLFDGTYLREGMRVLAANFEYRRDLADLSLLTDNPSEYRAEEFRLKELNRWCTVGQIGKETEGSRFQFINFIGTYDDGMVIKRTASLNAPWIVKNDTIPEDVKDSWTPEITVRSESVFSSDEEDILRAVIQDELDRGKPMVDVIDSILEKILSPSDSRRYNTELRIGIIEDPSQADQVLVELNKLIALRGSASVADLYALMGLTPVYVDELFEWGDLQSATVVVIPGGYTLDLPIPRRRKRQTRNQRERDYRG
jgi:hypothetical protein